RRDRGNRRDAMRHPYAEALRFQAFLQDGADIEAKAASEKDTGIALRGDRSREFARIDPRRGHQFLESPSRAIEPWLVKRSDDFRDEGILAALLEAREGIDRGAIAYPTLRRIVCRHGLGGRTAECCLGCCRQFAERLERDCVGAFAKLRPNPASPLLVLFIQR